MRRRQVPRVLRPDVPFLASRSSSVRVRLGPELARRVLRYVPATGVQCIPRVRLPRELVPLVLVRDYRLQVRFVLAVVQVRQRDGLASGTCRAV